jgi:hypothetical protein
MPADSDNLRLTAYFGVGAIFLALLAFVIFGFPDPSPVGSPLTGEKPIKKKSGGSSFAKHSNGGKKITDPSEAAEGENANDPSIAGDVIIRGKSIEELAKIFTRALEAGGTLKGINRGLLAARISFPSRAAAEDFRESLGDSELSDSNYVVMAPDFPGDGADRNTTSGEFLEPFGNRALEFLGIT